MLSIQIRDGRVGLSESRDEIKSLKQKSGNQTQIELKDTEVEEWAGELGANKKTSPS